MLALPALGAVSFPDAADDIGPHCFAAGAGAAALGERYPLDKNAVELGKQGQALMARLANEAALPRSYMVSLKTSNSPLRPQLTAFLESAGLMKDGEPQWSVSGAQEVGAHLTKCTTWVGSRAPVIPEMPQQREAAIDHCFVVLIASQQLDAYKGPRTGEAGALLSRSVVNGREILGEAQQRGLINPQQLRARAAPPKGDLFEPGIDLLWGLKLIALPVTKSLDVRSMRMLDQRLRQCHRLMGLQMPLQ